MASPVVTYTNSSSLADILERILDKGIVVAGDISISLVGVELLTIKIRLLVASVDKAVELGLTWWESDYGATSAKTKELEAENIKLRDSLASLEYKLDKLLTHLPAELQNSA